MFALTFSGKSPSPACYPAQQVLLVKWYHSQGWRPLEKKKKKKKGNAKTFIYAKLLGPYTTKKAAASEEFIKSQAQAVKMLGQDEGLTFFFFFTIKIFMALRCLRPDRAAATVHDISGHPAKRIIHGALTCQSGLKPRNTELAVFNFHF